MDFIFLRHGHYHQPEGVPSALLPHPLTEKGRNQALEGAKKVVELFQDTQHKLPSVIECSSALRAYETATIIQQELSKAFGQMIPIGETSQLTERNLGAAANLTVEEIESVLEKDPRYGVPEKGWKSSKDYCLPFVGAESLRMAGSRVAQVIQNPNDYLKFPKSGESNAIRIIVGHGASFRHACEELCILQPHEVKARSMFHAEPMYFTGSCTNWKHVSGEWKIREKSEQPD